MGIVVVSAGMGICHVCVCVCIRVCVLCLCLFTWSTQLKPPTKLIPPRHLPGCEHEARQAEWDVSVCRSRLGPGTGSLPASVVGSQPEQPFDDALAGPSASVLEEPVSAPAPAPCPEQLEREQEVMDSGDAADLTDGPGAVGVQALKLAAAAAEGKGSDVRAAGPYGTVAPLGNDSAAKGVSVLRSIYDFFSFKSLRDCLTRGAGGLSGWFLECELKGVGHTVIMLGLGLLQRVKLCVRVLDVAGSIISPAPNLTLNPKHNVIIFPHYQSGQAPGAMARQSRTPRPPSRLPARGGRQRGVGSVGTFSGGGLRLLTFAVVSRSGGASTDGVQWGLG